MKRLKWEKTCDDHFLISERDFLFTEPEKGYFYRIAIKKDKYYGMQYVAELWYAKHEDFGRLSPWSYVDCNSLEKAKKIIREHYKNVLAKRNGKSRTSKKRKV